VRLEGRDAGESDSGVGSGDTEVADEVGPGRRDESGEAAEGRRICTKSAIDPPVRLVQRRTRV